jgi:HEAT repeat protein
MNKHVPAAILLVVTAFGTLTSALAAPLRLPGPDSLSAPEPFARQNPAAGTACVIHPADPRLSTPEGLIGVLRIAERDEQEKLLPRLVAMGERAVEPLLAVLREPYSIAREKKAEAWFPICGNDLTFPLPQDSPETVRRLALRALGDIRDRRAVQPCIDILRGPMSFGEKWAVYALGRIGDRRAIPVLRERASRKYLNYEETDIAVACASALTEFGADGVDALSRVVQTQGAAGKQAALWELWRINPRRAFKPTIHVIQHDSRARLMALEVVCRGSRDHRRKAPLALIDALLRDPDKEVREATLDWCAFGLDDRRLFDRLKKYFEAGGDYPYQVMMALLASDKSRAIQYFSTELLGHSNEGIRGEAVRHLGWEGDLSVVPALERLVATESDAFTRESAARAIVDIRKRAEASSKRR